MHELYSIAEITKIKTATLVDFSSYSLIQRAGIISATYVMNLTATKKNVCILILVGPDNNGCNALETASCLALSNLFVAVALYVTTTNEKTDIYRALQHARNNGVIFLNTANFSYLFYRPWTLIIDGLFGIELTHAIYGKLRAVISYINRLTYFILALDIPSGLNADTGSVIGGVKGIAVKATYTLTFIGDKPGLHTCDGIDYSGNVTISTLGINRRYFIATNACINNLSLFNSCLIKKREYNTHKGMYGNVIIIGGAHGMAGALILAARMAMQAGVGRIFAAFIENPPIYDNMYPELMMRNANDIKFSDATVVVIGPGLGTSRQAYHILSRVLIETRCQLLIDADALNIIAIKPDLQHKLQQHSQYMNIITPHPLEAARLLNITVSDVQFNRLSTARLLANYFQCIVILKGAGTIIALSNKTVVINTTGNSALSKAGTGDVLSGLCGAFLAQGWKTKAAALASVWLHGKAADELVSYGIGPIGLTMHELIYMIRNLINKYMMK